MKNQLILLAAVILWLFASCDLVDESPCGPKNTFDLYLLGSSIVDTTTGLYYSYLSGTERVFQWSQIVEGVCTEEHVNTEFRVALLDETTTGVLARGRVSWQFFFENEFPLTQSGSDIKGSGETGLKQAFDSMEGWYVPAVEIYFPTKGSYGADTAFLKQNVISVEMMSKYREFKE